MPGLTYDDDIAVRAALDRTTSQWCDPDSYAASLRSDAQHIGPTGEIARGRSAIADAHATAVSTWGRASQKSARVDRLQFLCDDVALLTVYGEVRSVVDTGAPALRTIESVSALRVDATWELVSVQQTPLGTWPVLDPDGARAPSSDRAATGDIGAGADAAGIGRLYEGMLAAWLDAPRYAEFFTHDADYITGGGLLERGWFENVRGHSIIFSAWARDSHLHGQLAGIRFVTNDIALLTAHGHIVFDDHRGDTGKRTVYTLTARRTSSGWIFVGYQNTPLISLHDG